MLDVLSEAIHDVFMDIYTYFLYDKRQGVIWKQCFMKLVICILSKNEIIKQKLEVCVTQWFTVY